MYFLPGIPWLQIGHRVLPEAEIQVQWLQFCLMHSKIVSTAVRCYQWDPHFENP